MDRRTFLAAITAAVPAIAIARRRASAQDLEFLRALAAAQAGRPDTIARNARIAPEREPGPALVIDGRVDDAAGTPAADAIVFAYHTDREGLYDQPGNGAHSWRLRGWARTDAQGRFEFRTIRPAPYPGRRIPAHVHFNIYTLNGNFHGGELRFADDTLVDASERAASERAGAYGWVRPVTTRGNTQVVKFALRLDPERRF